MTNGKDRKYASVSLSRKTSARINPRWLILLAGKKTGDRGFTMLEVLIAIMVITFFLAGTLQLMAIDTLYKILAKQQANAAQWIQEDVEEVRALAADTTRIPRNDSLCKPTTTSPNSYGLVLEAMLDNETTAPGSTLPAATNKSLLLPNGKVYDMVRDTRVTADQPSVVKITYSVIDTEASAGTNQDINRRNNSTIATFYTEVIPASSFQCP